MIRCYTVSVATPGTPQNLFTTINALAGNKLAQLSGGLSGPLDMRVKGLMFQADPGNTAAKNIYIGSPDLNVATHVGIGLALSPTSPPSYWIEFDDSTSASLAEIFIDADTGATTARLFVMVDA